MAPKPFIGTVADGLIVELQAAAEGSEVTFTAIDAKLTRLVKLCDCVATVDADGETVRLASQEPLVLRRASEVPGLCGIRVKPGQAVLVPIRRASLVVRRSNVRALVREGKAQMKKDGTAKFLAGLDARGYPIECERGLFLVLTASVVKEADEVRRPKSG